jgi:hypothetical protein
MNGSGEFNLEECGNFIEQIEKFIKINYNKNKPDAERFKELLIEIKNEIIKNPLCPKSFSEPWPDGSHNSVYELRKYFFNVPGLKGSSREGRLMYLYCREKRTVNLLMLYTHKQYEKRPDNKLLKSLLEEVTR